MPQFHYEAVKADGEPVVGQVVAEDVKSALLQLIAEGLTVKAIQQVEEASQETAAREHGTSQPVRQPGGPAARDPELEVRALESQLSRVLTAGPSLAPALMAYAAEMPRGRYRRELKQIASQLQRGGDAAHVLASRQIPERWIPLLSAATGETGQVLTGLITASRRIDDIKRQILFVLTYPLVVAVFAFCVVVAICILIVPTFKSIFLGFDMSLPAITQWAIYLSDLALQSRGLIVLVPVLVIAAAVVLYRHLLPPAARDFVLDCVPLVGRALRLTSLARFTHHLAALVEAEVPTATALRIAARSAQRHSLAVAARQLSDFIESGASPPGQPAASDALPATVIHALQLDSSPPAGAGVLRELSWMYDSQARDTLSWCGSVTEPLFIVVLGGFVGFLVLALMLPLFSLIEGLS